MRFLLKVYLLLSSACSPLAAATLSGELAVLVADRIDRTSETLFYLRLPDGGMLELVGPNTAKLPLISEIPITVEIEDGQLIDFSTDVDIEIETKRRAEIGLDERRAATFIIDLPTKKASAHTSRAALAEIMQHVDRFYRAASIDQVRFPAPPVIGPLLVSNVAENCQNHYKFASEARAQGIASGEYVEANYQHRIYVLPHQRQLGCAWLGLASLGCLNRCDMWISYPPNLTVYTHELGHNLGAHHAATDPEDDGVLNVEYGDHSDVMGNRLDAVSQFNPPHLEQMGWYGALKPNWLRLVPRGQSATIDLAPLAITGPADHAQAIKVPRAKGGHYYLSFRFPEGLDAPLDNRYRYTISIHAYAGGRVQTRFIRSVGISQRVRVGNIDVQFNPTSVRDVAEVKLKVN